MLAWPTWWQLHTTGPVSTAPSSHPASRELAREVCRACGVEPTSAAVYPALERDDRLAAAFARLLLWTDSRPLPAPAAGAQAAWDYYTRNWRPGKPHRRAWDALYLQAVGLLPADFSRVTGSVTSTERPA